MSKLIITMFNEAVKFMDTKNMLRSMKNVLAVLVSCLAVALLPNLVQAQTAPSQPTEAQSVTPAATSLTPQSYDYRLGSADKVRITVFGEPDLTGEFTVSGDGKIAFPLIGDVQALGANATELQTTIATALAKGYLKDPRVNVEILAYRPFYILGEVNKPGEYPFSNGMTIERAVATAAGYTYRANHKKVFIKHAGSDDEVEVKISGSATIAPGDTIRVVERYF